MWLGTDSDAVTDKSAAETIQQIGDPLTACAAAAAQLAAAEIQGNVVVDDEQRLRRQLAVAQHAASERPLPFMNVCGLTSISFVAPCGWLQQPPRGAPVFQTAPARAIRSTTSNPMLDGCCGTWTRVFRDRQ